MQKKLKNFHLATQIKPIRIRIFENLYDKKGREIEFSWSEFCECLQEFDYTPDKKGRLLSICEYVPGANRCDDNAIGAHLLGVDLDDISDKDLALFFQILNLHNWRFFAHTTFKHPQALQKNTSRLRFFFELDRMVAPVEWFDFWSRAVARLGGPKKTGGIDISASNISRAFYVPMCRAEDIELMDYYQGGTRPISVDDILKDPPPKFLDKLGRKGLIKRRWEEIKEYEAPPEETAISRQWLAVQCNIISSVDPKAPFHNLLNRTAYMVGQRIPHLLQQETAYKELMKACEKRKGSSIDDFCKTSKKTYREKYKSIIEHAFLDAQDPEKSSPFIPDSNIGKSDASLAIWLCRELEGVISYVRQWGSWMVYQNKVWVLDHKEILLKDLVFRKIQQLYTHYAAMKEVAPKVDLDAKKKPPQSKAEKIKKFLVLKENDAALSALVRMMAVVGQEAHRHQDDFDASPSLLNTPSGTVDLKTGILMPSSPSDLHTKITRVGYDPKAKCPLFLQFFEDILEGDQDLMTYMHRVLGYIITGEIKEQSLYFLLGTGSNGKSTLIQTIASVLGGGSETSYAAKGPDTLLLTSRGDEHPTKTSILYKTRLVYIPELDQRKAWAEDAIKDYTGEGFITTRRMREDFWTFRLMAKIVAMANKKPRVFGTDEGIWRRIKITPFRVNYKGPTDDKTLIVKFEEEYEGILAWLVEGAKDYYKWGIPENKKVIEAVREYRIEEDDFGAFFHTFYTISADVKDRISRGDLWGDYLAYCESEGTSPTERMSNRAIAKRLREMGLKEGNGQNEQGVYYRYWGGLKKKEVR